MKKLLLFTILALFPILSFAQNNEDYYMQIEMKNGSKMLIDIKDVDVINFNKGTFSMSGTSIESILDEIEKIKARLDKLEGNSKPDDGNNNQGQDDENHHQDPNINPNVNSGLEGTWAGNMYISSEWDGRYYDATSTEVTFLRDPFTYTSGTGYWVDYYSNAPWDYVANHIDWNVSNGVIRIYFREEGTRIEIRDYRLNNSLFTGTINDNGYYVDFQLYKVSRPYSYWDDYRWGYDSWHDDYYYWSRTRTSIDKTNREKSKPIRLIRK